MQCEVHEAFTYLLVGFGHLDLYWVIFFSEVTNEGYCCDVRFAWLAGVLFPHFEDVFNHLTLLDDS